MTFKKRIKHLFARAVVFANALFLLKNVKAAYILSKHPERFKKNIKNKVKWRNGNFYLVEANLSLPVKNFHQIQGDFDLLLEVSKFGTIRIVNDDLAIELPAGGKQLIFIIYRHEVLENIKEVFVDRIYEFAEFEKNEYIVMDIGMNVGVASLYFSSLDNVRKVYGYEPLNANFKLATESFERNEEISKKIILHNYGLDNTDAELELSFAHAGDMGFSTSDFVREKAKNNKVINGRVEKIKIRNIGDEISLIRNEFRDSRIMLKLDCEGSEYNIIQYLNDKFFLEHISIAAIEWHYKGPEMLVQLLKKNNFRIIHMEEHSNNYTGIIKAINNDK